MKLFENFCLGMAGLFIFSAVFAFIFGVLYYTLMYVLKIGIERIVAIAIIGTITLILSLLIVALRIMIGDYIGRLIVRYKKW